MNTTTKSLYSRGFSFSLLWALFFACQAPLPEEIAGVYDSLPDQVDFNFHIRPILSDRCYSCHGPDNNARETSLRLDQEASAFSRLEGSGESAFVRSSLGKSAAWQRIIAEDPERQMPPPSSNLSLSAKEKALIAKWIEQGAEWKKHWAFIPPQKPEVPRSSERTTRNSIDPFIQAKLKEVDLPVSPPADKERLIRRLTRDLTGLPPTLEEIDDFLEDERADAYERVIDRLMGTDAYAERMTMEWLDVARYADSHGLHADGLRIQWPWRDWVIKSFKKNLPYDEFVSWQLAGDLLPEATREQKLATAFNRNHPINSESGIVGEEYRLKYVADRTNTTATAFLGLTMECAACHDHKFDPISQKEYYQMTSFFNQIDELGMTGNDLNFGPLLMLPEPEVEKKISKLDKQIAGLERQIGLRKRVVDSIQTYIEKLSKAEIQLPDGGKLYPLESLKPVKKEGRITRYIADNNPKSFVSKEPELVKGKVGKGVRIDGDFEQIFLSGIKHIDLVDPISAGSWIKVEKQGRFQTIIGNIGDKNNSWRGWVFYLDSLNRPAIYLVHNLSYNYLQVVAKEPIDTLTWTHTFFTYDGSAKATGLSIYVNGQKVAAEVKHDNLYKNIRPVKTRSYIPNPEKNIRLGKAGNYLFADTDDGNLIGSYDQVRIFPIALTSLELARIYEQESKETLPDFGREEYREHYLKRGDIPLLELENSLRVLRKKKYQLQDTIPEVMVQEDRPNPRATFILNRGQYDMPGEEVFASTPESVFSFPKEFPKNRLGLALWLFDKQNPLTARVAVNRYWQMLFGRGLVETPHDFGSQGALPSHPELLDWLAVEFRESGWNLRHLLKLMLNSYTYRQNSSLNEEMKAKDTKNIYLARGPSYRLSAEMIRDNALAASGLLNPEIGGESVKPYQPPRLWIDKNEFSGYLLHYKQDTGDKLYRRSMYTFIRRTSPPPAMTAFDAPSREICTVKREKTNTPMQALILMNDPQFVEASRMLAERMQKEGSEDWESKVQLGFRLTCGRRANPVELALLKKQYQESYHKFTLAPQKADELLEVGEYPYDPNLDKIETASLAMLANTMMNFDEAYMKR